MAVNLLKHKRSAVPNKAPTIGSLSLGELAINTHDGCVYLKRAGVSGEEIVKLAGFIADDSRVIVDTFTGDGSTTDFVLSVTPQSENFCFVTINGVDQHVASYSLSVATLTLSEAPANGDAIEVRTLNTNQAEVSLRDYKSYVYQPTTSTTTINGVDENGNTLEYDIEKVEVYLNGVRLVNGLDYSATNGSSIVLEAAITSGDTLEVVSLSKAAFIEKEPFTSNTTFLSTTTANQVVDGFSLSQFRTAKYLISISHDTAGFQSEEILVMHDDTDTYLTVYAQMFTNVSLGDFSATISGDTVQLTFSPNYINTTIKLQRTTVAV